MTSANKGPLALVAEGAPKKPILAINLRVMFFFWRNENSRQILPATLSLTAAHSLSPIGREVAGLSITDQEDQGGRGRSPEAGNACW